jgi:hypothetical protein
MFRVKGKVFRVKVKGIKLLTMLMEIYKYMFILDVYCLGVRIPTV